MKDHEVKYKLCWRVPRLQGIYTDWTKFDNEQYDTIEKARIAMFDKGSKLCQELAGLYMTKADIYNYNVVESEFKLLEPVVACAVIVRDNKYLFSRETCGFLQIFEI